MTDVWTREDCLRYNCFGGKAVNEQGQEEVCDQCEGKGYVEEWQDLSSLVRSVIRID